MVKLCAKVQTFATFHFVICNKNFAKLFKSYIKKNTLLFRGHYRHIVKTIPHSETFFNKSQILLIGIFDEALVLGFKGRHDAVVGLIHGSLDVLWALTNGIDGLVDGQGQGMPMGEVPVLHARHDIERAIDGEGNDRQLELVSEHEGSFLESSHVTCKRTGTLWEHDNGAVARL